jgi:hypothetical protein
VDTKDDKVDADEPRDTTPGVLASDDDTDTFYRPDLSKTVPSTSDAKLGQPELPKEPASRLAAIIRFIVPRRRRAHRDGAGWR